MCVAAEIMKRTRKTAVIGMSTCFFGMPPNDHVVGRYGGPFASIFSVKPYRTISADQRKPHHSLSKLGFHDYDFTVVIGH